MAPTLRDGERTLVPRYEAWAVRFALADWEAGDVVYFRAPGDQPVSLVDRLLGGPFIIKRIIATGGQVVAFEHGRLTVDGEAVDVAGPSSVPFSSLRFSPTPVPEGHLFVLGDNRAPLASRDSRAFGSVPASSIAGRAAWVVWPPLRRDHAGVWRWNVRRVP